MNCTHGEYEKYEEVEKHIASSLKATRQMRYKICEES